MDRICLESYQIEMLIIKDMFDKKMIDESDYIKAERFLSKKHCIDDKSTYRLNNLICTQKYGMYIHEGKEIFDDQSKEDRKVERIT